MPRWLLLALAAGALNAAAIRGVVVEHQSGRPLARALVTIQPVAGTAGATVSARTNVYGAFEFPAVLAGAYLVTASRRGFAPWQYGQKRWKAAGVPIVLDQAGSAVLNLRLQRFGSIAGTVVDENEVGLPDHEVMAYRNTRPPQLATHASTDDRGMYRLWGLEPGAYLVRTAPKKDNEDSYVPTFARDASRVDEARPVEVELDRQTDDVSVRPFPGRLYSLAGQAYLSPQVPVTVTLVSDVGSQNTTSDSSGNFHFDFLAPGMYELFAQAPADRRAGRGLQAAFAPVILEREHTDLRMRLGELADLEIQAEDVKGQPVDLALFQVMARRKDLSGDGKPETLRVRQNHATLLPGRWDLALATTAGYYVAQFAGPQGEGAARGRPDGWNEIVASGGAIAVKFVLSPNPGVVRGTVTAANHDPVAGAPVYLEAYDPETHKRLTDLRTARSDLEGKYQFYGLAPGAYRVLSTFEYQAPDSAALDAAGARIVKVEEARESATDLALYIVQ